MEKSKLWSIPDKEEQDALRVRLFDLLNRKPRSKNSLGSECKLSPATIHKFLVLEERVDWISYHKILAMVEKNEKALNEVQI